jgi:hypothetical protein
MRKPFSTTRHRHSGVGGHVKRSPTGHDPGRSSPALLRDFPSGVGSDFGARGERRDVVRQSNITIDRRRSTPNPLGKRMTKFITNVTGQVQIPRNLLSSKRMSDSERDSHGQRHLDVGQVPED